MTNDDLAVLMEKANPRLRLYLARKYSLFFDNIDDVLQEAALKVFLHYDTFQGRAKFSTWYTRIVINEMLVLIRKRGGRKLEVSIDEELPRFDHDIDSTLMWELCDKRPSPEELAIADERRRHLISCIEMLTPMLRRHSRALLVSEFKVKAPAVKARHFRARHTLRAIFQERGLMGRVGV